MATGLSRIGVLIYHIYPTPSADSLRRLPQLALGLSRSTLSPTRQAMKSTPEFLASCILFAKQHPLGLHGASPTSSEGSNFDSIDDYESSVSSGSPPHAISQAQATFYYAGISRAPPKLVFTTSAVPWVKPTGPEAYRRLKQLRPVYDHKLNDLWDTLGPEVVGLLDKQQIRFSSVDVVRFRSGTKSDVTLSPVVLWIGVLPGSLLGEDAFDSAQGLLELLKSHSIYDVDIEFRESVYRRSTGPALYAPVSSVDAARKVIDPLTTSLGIPIASSKTPHFNGTLGFFFAEGGQSQDVFAVTARHVLFPPDEDNADYQRNKTSAARKDVLVMGTQAWDVYLQSVQLEIGNLGIDAEVYEEQVELLAKKALGDTPAAKRAAKEMRENEALLAKARESIDELEELYETTKKAWAKPKDRVIGHTVRSPAITVNAPPLGFARDFAIIKLDKEKFKNVEGGMNVLELGTEIDPASFTRLMYPRRDTQPGFKYPPSRQLELGEILPEALLRRPDMLDINGEACLLVTKRGLTTKTTVGRATGIFSYVREYFSNETHRTSMEWAILPYDNESGAFSKTGDSGSVIVDRKGRYGGLLTGGAGKTESSDVTYATPMFDLWEDVKAIFPHAHLHPVINVA